MAGFMLNSHIKHPRKGIAWHVSLVICCCIFGHSRYPFPSSSVTQVPLPPFYLMYFLGCLNKAMAQMANNTKERKASCTISTYLQLEQHVRHNTHWGQAESSCNASRQENPSHTCSYRALFLGVWNQNTFLSCISAFLMGKVAQVLCYFDNQMIDTFWSLWRFQER